MPRLSPTLHSADRALVKGLNEGDETAFAALYDEYGERLYDYTLSMSGDEKVAADIVHDTFIDAGRRAPRMRDHLHLSSWLYGAARRRCIRRGRAKILFWDRNDEFSDIPFLDRAEPEGPAPDWPPSDELHGLFRAALAKLEPVEQEVLLLAFRHGLRPARLGATLGLSARRSALRVRDGRAEIEAALQREVQRANRACAAGTADSAEEPRPVAACRTRARQDEADAPPAPRESGSPGTARASLGKRLLGVLHRRPEAPPADPVVERHVAGCPSCRRRGRVTAAALFRRAPAPVLPAALRHRVMHTATDPELAGYRADIAARGGALTPSGLPSQPDVPSPFTRRWLFTGGGMAGALAAALVAVFVMGPGIAGDSLSWPPFRTEPQPSITEHAPPNGSRPDTQPSREPESGGPGGRPAQPPVRPQTDERTPEESADPTRPAPPPESNQPPGPGDLVVNPAKVELYGTKTGQVSLAAESGPVTWTAMSSTSQLVLSEMQGGMPEDGKATVTVNLRTFLIGLPGQGTLTFTDSEGAQKQVTVVWGASLL
ncbi:sigma-70 family RNA polymerase sigma factor [Actinomadura sp. KC345]|uniref:RNA polymerase sigma factor n=1 Tax=Actinomadura sp. KC345 TaxID=2530371 RepID=UPI00104CF8AE|nr:sigma-70 family RNA polymerase sigma factor [Actinomadura sp. KC345]TDC44374.1 sigma-70 family RNA polymerase sigma factor [Actinomadura sp. KC345]